MALCVGAVPILFGPSGADRREVQDGCQNGQLWLGVPLVRFDHSLFKHNGRLLRATNHGHCHKPRVTRGDVVILSLCREAAFESEAACELRPAAVDAQLDERFVKGRQRKDYDLA